MSDSPASKKRERVSYEEVWNFLQARPIYPDGATKDRRRSIRRLAAHFVIDQDVLFRVFGGVRQRWVADKHEQEEVLRACHAHPKSGHWGRDKTRKKVCERYYWQGAYEDVDRFVQNCTVCQSTEKTLRKRKFFLHSTPVKRAFWSAIQVELIGPLTETSCGNRYILTCMDILTRWPEAIPLKNKTPSTVADSLLHLFYRHGYCEDIRMTDQSTEFVDEVGDCLHELCGVKLKVTSTCQEQGEQTEELDHSLVDALRSLTETDEHWDSASLDTTLFTYRTTVHKSTQRTPFRMVFGREACLPVSVEHTNTQNASSEEGVNATPLALDDNTSLSTSERSTGAPGKRHQQPELDFPAKRTKQPY